MKNILEKRYECLNCGKCWDERGDLQRKGTKCCDHPDIREITRSANSNGSMRYE